MILIAADQMEFKIEYLMKVLMTIIIIHAVMIVIQRATASIIWPFSYDESGKQFFYISENYYNTQEKMVRCPGNLRIRIRCRSASDLWVCDAEGDRV